MKSISAAQLPTPQGKLQDLGQGANILQASVSHYLQCGPSSWSLESPSPIGRKPSPAALSGPVVQPWGCPGAAAGSQREEPGNPGGAPPSSPGQAPEGAPEGAPAAPRNALQMREALPAFLEGNAGRAGGGGTAAARCQMCTANSCPRLIRSAPGSGEPRTHCRLRPPGTRCRASRGGLGEGPERLPTLSGLGRRAQNPLVRELGARNTQPPCPSQHLPTRGGQNPTSA